MTHTHRDDDKHLRRQELPLIYNGAWDHNSHPNIFSHLDEDCELCDDALFILPDGQNQLELSTHDAELILNNVLREIEPQRRRFAQKHARAQRPSLWERLQQSLSSPMLWAPVACLMLFFVPISIEIFRQSPSPHPASHPEILTMKGTKGAKKAFLRVHSTLKLQATEKGPSYQTLPFQANSQYSSGDGLELRFLLTQPGYLALLRVDLQGNIEQLFPFSERNSKVYKAGEMKLIAQGRPQIYFLDRHLKGKQRLMLIHSDSRIQRFSKSINALSRRQRLLLKQADVISFVVVPRS